MPLCWRKTRASGSYILTVRILTEKKTLLFDWPFIKECSIGYNGCIAIAEALRVNGSLQILSLKHNSLQYAGGEALLKAVTEANGTLRKLELVKCCTWCLATSPCLLQRNQPLFLRFFFFLRRAIANRDCHFNRA